MTATTDVVSTRIPTSINPLLEEYMTQVDTSFPGLIAGFYLEGSLALDAFNENFSDVDFVAVISRSCTELEIEQLRVIHQFLGRKYPKWPLEGNYVRWENHQLVSCLRYHDGKLRSDTDIDLNSVPWWILKNRGLAIRGTEPHQLELAVNWDVLIIKMKHNLNTYWQGFTNNPSRMSWLLTNYGIQWAVLGILRQFYSFREHTITSKVGAGKYGLTCLPAKWHRVIQEALNIRSKTGQSLYTFRIVRAIDALRFLKFVIKLCNSTV